MESQPQNAELEKFYDFLWKVSLKIMNSGIILKTFTHGITVLKLSFMESHLIY